jgi:hypothetical protein
MTVAYRTFLLAALLTSAAAAQVQTALVPDALGCTRCSIAMRLLVTLGTEQGPGSIITVPNGMAVDGRGRYWVTQESELPFVYDRSGAFLQAVGTKGQGPGEFDFAYAPTPIPGDSVLVMDSQRMTVVGPDLRPVRTLLTGIPIGRLAVAHWPSQVIGTRSGYGRDMMQRPLLRLDFSGPEPAVLGGFGPDRGDLDPRYPLLQNIRSFVNGRMWSNDGPRYRMSRWLPDGTLERSLERRPDWFVSPEPGGPRPHVSAVSEDSSGLLWAFVNVRAPTWREAMPPMAPGQREIAARSIAFEKYLRTTIEVIDPRTAQLVVRRELNELIVAVWPDGRAAAYVVDGDGVARLKVYALSIDR